MQLGKGSRLSKGCACNSLGDKRNNCCVKLSDGYFSQLNMVGDSDFDHIGYILDSGKFFWPNSRVCDIMFT